VVCTLLTPASAEVYLYEASVFRASERGEEQLTEEWAEDLLSRADGDHVLDVITVDEDAAPVEVARGMVIDTACTCDADDCYELTEVAPETIALPVNLTQGEDA
jgi:hypothetical protein